MKKTILFSINLMLMTVLAFSACSDDNDNNDSLIGTTWVATDPEYFVRSISFTSNTNVTFKFNNGNDDNLLYTSQGMYGTINIVSDPDFKPILLSFSISGSIMQILNSEGDLWGVYQRK